MHRCAVWVGLCAALAVAVATPAVAEVHVEGSAPALRVTTSEDAIADVLSALGPPFNVKVRTAVALDATADPAYWGSVREVIVRLLDGYDYVVRTGHEETEVVVLGRRGEGTVPAMAVPTASNGRPARRR